MSKKNAARAKDPAAVAMGKKGGAATARRRLWLQQTPEERTERARQAGEARWEGHNYSMKPAAVYQRARRAKKARKAGSE